MDDIENRESGADMDAASDTSESTTRERELDDDLDSMMGDELDSQSSLGASFEDMDLDSAEYAAKCRESPITRLPAELLISIFSKLNAAYDLRNCMLVSKVWARNAVDLLWHKPQTNSWPAFINVAQTVGKSEGYFNYRDLVRRLNLAQLVEKEGNAGNISDGTLSALAVCKRIERLTLTNCNNLTDSSVVVMIEGSRNLLAIDLTGLDGITDRTLAAIAKNCSRLQGLNVTKCIRVTDESVKEIALNCPKVKRLKLNDCVQLTDEAVIYLAKNCRDILEIDLHGCHLITDGAVTELLTYGRQLRELRLAHCNRISNTAFTKLRREIHVESLRILDLTECNELEDDGLAAIIHSAPRIRNLVLAKCRHITDRGVNAITRLGKNLHYIHLGHCSRITDTGLTTLIRMCNRIRYIDLACCALLTDDSVELLSTLPKLKRIGLVKCSLITDRSIEALAKVPNPGTTLYLPNLLERLHLSYCTALTRQGIRLMLMNCKRLTHLSLTGVPDFLHEDLLQFCREAPHEFNEHQRDAFCVFSGEGVAKLRNHLKHAPEQISQHHIEGLDSDSDGTVDSGIFNSQSLPSHSHQNHLPFQNTGSLDHHPIAGHLQTAVGHHGGDLHQPWQPHGYVAGVHHDHIPTSAFTFQLLPANVLLDMSLAPPPPPPLMHGRMLQEDTTDHGILILPDDEDEIND